MDRATEPTREQQPLSLAEPLMTANDAAELLAVRPSWVYEAVRAGELPCLKVGRHIPFTRPLLEAWLESRLSGS